MEIDFYKVRALTDKDISLVRLLASHEKQHPMLRENVVRFLHYVLGPAILEDRYPDALKDAGLSQELDAYRTNIVDDHHTFFERSFLPLLAQSLREDIRWYEDGLNRITFYTYIAAQNLRTRRVKSRTIARLGDGMGLDISRIWPILSVVFAFSSGFSMYAELQRRPLTLVRNRTSVPFLTGDQPVINLDADGETAPESLSFYYPLSPRLALYLAESGEPLEIPASIETADIVAELNLRIAQASHGQIYASAAGALEDIKERLAQAN